MDDLVQNSAKDNKQRPKSVIYYFRCLDNSLFALMLKPLDPNLQAACMRFRPITRMALCVIDAN